MPNVSSNTPIFPFLNNFQQLDQLPHLMPPPKKKTIIVVGNKGKGCVFSIFWCSQIGDHPQGNLAKFDYKPDMKIKKLMIF
jgi:hypothetical protein